MDEHTQTIHTQSTVYSFIVTAVYNLLCCNYSVTTVVNLLLPLRLPCLVSFGWPLLLPSFLRVTTYPPAHLCWKHHDQVQLCTSESHGSLLSFFQCTPGPQCVSTPPLHPNLPASSRLYPLSRLYLLSPIPILVMPTLPHGQCHTIQEVLIWPRRRRVQPTATAWPYQH